jgi:hypothetical protein
MVPESIEDEALASTRRFTFRPEIVSNNGDALEKMGIVDPSDNSFWRKLFDLLL